MAIHFPGRMRGQANALEVSVMPAPTKGLDARAPTGNMPPDVCIYTYNLMPAEYGMLIRPGYREWNIGLDLGSGDGVYSIIPYTGVAQGSSDDRLFAMTNEAIWDVTAYDSPVNKLTFGSSQLGSGHGVSAHYIDQAGNDWLYYADAINGLHIYAGATNGSGTPDTWVKATDEITGVDPNGPDLNLGAVVFVVVHKQRMWLVEEGASHAWYLGQNAGLGDATKFHFGTKFPHGGRVYAMYNWSIDGGQGVDDMLVVVSSSGDVVVYQGSDPEATDWSVRGTYYIGDVPQGRRIGTEYAGDLYLISSFGLQSMGDLVRGVDSLNPAETSLSYRIARPLRTQIAAKRSEFGWEPVYLPPLGAMHITVPNTEGERWIQYNATLATEGWGIYRDVPMRCVTDYLGKVYFGDEQGRVCVMDTTRDNMLITAPPEPELNGDPIEFSILSSYQNLNTPGLHKRVQMVRPDFYGDAKPAFEQRILYDYDVTEPPTPQDLPGNQTEGFRWDDPGALWDNAVWATNSGVSYGAFLLGGVAGIGRTLAVALKGTTGTEIRLLSWDIMWQTGGPI